MVSRINMGPDGGPHIAINENSGDIELEDNSGNVVAKWDETNTQWDFSSNDIQNVGSLDVQNGATFNGTDLSGVGSLGVEELSLGNVVAVASWDADGTAQTIPTSTFTKVEWEVAEIEDSNIATVDLSNDEIVIQEGGKYEISAYVSWLGSANFGTGEPVRIRIMSNGTEEKTFRWPSISDDWFTTKTPTVELSLSVGDAMSIEAEHTTGSDQDLYNNASFAPILSQFRVKRSG